MTLPELFEHAVATLKALQRIEAQNAVIIRLLNRSNAGTLNSLQARNRRLTKLLIQKESKYAGARELRELLSEFLQTEKENASHERAVKHKFNQERNQ